MRKVVIQAGTISCWDSRGAQPLTVKGGTLDHKEMARDCGVSFGSLCDRSVLW